MTRREFLKRSAWAVTGFSTMGAFARADAPDPRPILSFGIVTDTHYADTAPRGSRHYRESIPKLREFVKLMNDEKVDFVVELGDFKDQESPPVEATSLAFLSDIERTYGLFRGPRYHVLGNHDLDSISKEQFLARVENTGIAKGLSYYSFDSHGCHFVVLDANYTADGADYDHGQFDWTDTNVPARQLDWLRQDLASASTPTMVFVHQRLDVEGAAGVKNAAAVRQVLQDSGRVRAVFQGHDHGGDYRQIKGIHYYTLRAMVEGSGEPNSAYAIVSLHADHRLRVTGYRLAQSIELK